MPRAAENAREAHLNLMFNAILSFILAITGASLPKGTLRFFVFLWPLAYLPTSGRSCVES
jgi:hypothetical protein